jgi:hypothetical protein
MCGYSADGSRKSAATKVSSGSYIDKKEEAKKENQLKALQRRLEEAEANRHEVRLAEECAAATIKKYEDAQAAIEEERKN